MTIVAAAHRCAAADLTPSLIAAILKVESNFDPRARRPSTHEYGIAMWTPRLFSRWRFDADGGGSSVHSPYDSIYAVGKYLCGIGPRMAAVPGDPALVLAATYRVGSVRVRAVRGIPPETRGYVRRVAHYARAYAEPAAPRRHRSA
jgi:soluble lytic murein transglycosylase-like protein